MAAGGLLLAASMALKTVNTEDARAMLESVAAAPGRFEASTLLQLAAAVLLLPALLGFAGLLRGHGGRPAAVALGLMFVNTAGNIGDAGMGAYVSSAASDGVSAADVSVIDHAQSGAIYSLISIMVLLGLLGFPLLAWSLYRARTVPVAVPALIAVAFVSFFLPISEGVGGGLLAIAFAIAAQRLVATGEPGMRAEGLEPPRLAATRT